MHQLIRWEPFRNADEFFRSFMQPDWSRGGSQDGDNAGSRQNWMPAVDIRETEREYTVIAEMPGLSREDVKVRVEGDVLTLEGERKEERDAQGEQAHRTERRYGFCSRRFSLPDNVEADEISADCRNGVVTIHIPKRAEPKPEAREISVQ